jgi:hypothetical protein
MWWLTFISFVRSLECLREVELNRLADVPASAAFLQRHGSKLLQLTAPLEILIKIDVFNLCTSLNTVVVVSPFQKAAPEAKVGVLFLIHRPAPTTLSPKFIGSPRKLYRLLHPAFRARQDSF